MESIQKEGANPVYTEMKIRFENQKSSKKLFKITLPTDLLIQNGMESICPVAFCQRKTIPKNRSIEEHLREHLIQVFRKVVTDCEIDSQPQFDVRYHCSIKECRYSDVSDKGKCFDSVKYLKQHYIKVHASKDFKCLKCQKAFPLQSFVESHQARCGMVFACSCGQAYSTLEALQTHVRRRKHSVDLTQYKKILSEEKSRIQELKTAELISKASIKSTTTTTNAKVSLSNKKKFQMILPDLSSTVAVDSSQPAEEQQQFEMINSYNELPKKKFVDFETQTGPQQQHLNSSKSNKLLGPKRKKSAETQTARVRVKVNTETQTTNVVKRRRSTRKKQSAEAQTQCHQEVSSQKENSQDDNNTSQIDTSLQTDVIRESNPDTLCSNEDSNIANPILGFNISDSFLKEMEVHNQTQTDPDDKFLFDGDNIFSDYDDVVNLTQNDTDDFLNFVTTETQTANPSTMYNNFMDSATDPFADVTAATCSGSLGFPSDEHLLSLNSSYLETIDNETQTQFDFWVNLLD